MAERTEILKCTCTHEFQDEIYGKGMRLHNVNTKGQAFCTVCCPNHRQNRMHGTTDIMPNAGMGNGFIPKKKDRNAKSVKE